MITRCLRAWARNDAAIYAASSHDVRALWSCSMHQADFMCCVTSFRPSTAVPNCTLVRTSRLFSSTSGDRKPARTPMPVYYSDIYTIELPAGHRFPMERYRTTYNHLRARIASEQGGDAGADLVVRESEHADMSAIERVHQKDYVKAFCDGTLAADAVRLIGFPWSQALVTRTRVITGGTISATYAALNNNGMKLDITDEEGGADCIPRLGISANAAGGTHHAFAASGEGFCIFNDIVVASKDVLVSEKLTGPFRVHRVLVIDLDVHQGNGTASMCDRDASVFTFSMHGERNYPWRSRYPSNYDVDVPDGASDDVYLGMLDSALTELEGRLRRSSRAATERRPRPWFPRRSRYSELAEYTWSCQSELDVQLVMYQAGVDPLGSDRLGRLKLTREGLQRRNALVFNWCDKHRLPVVVTMGGGYARPIERSAECHVDVFMQAAAAWRRRTDWFA